ncbi:Dodecanoyl-acyl-carrier-protein hydrolase, chloroplastic [Cinnamomum micranthum f. kanehirae]|uniref:Acyl-[acyl-carrier-protein] hydrolase n=1 Tax=Cinnamomum micranthum f. kanehirae TaxID=337451 RepID=A0A3S3NY57_9MAGN|nr:Dodecanoyl-acyl-carrier-protein hydrolase, chloroplastic [Cinnamomum micranthum f. kanehirae]
MAGGMKPRRSGLQLRAGNARVSLTTKTERLKGDITLPDWSKLLAVITTIFSAAEKQWTNLEWKPKPKPPHLLDDHFGAPYAIRCYEVGPDRSTSIVAVMNHLQEAALNHAESLGFLGDGFGETLEMSKRDLIWVVRRTHTAVERYPAWYASRSLSLSE